ncbi:hypothetical protein JTB14_026125 [Gonioctena quinquepunctata]|nr:hypothetical protein JTB14_026125 [Gonioctena quinquepunctata]
MIKERDKMRQNLHENPNNERHKELYRLTRNRITALIKRTKTTFFRNKIKQAHNNPKKLWQVIDELNLRKKHTGNRLDKIIANGNILEDSQGIANAMNSHYVSVVTETVKTAKPIHDEVPCASSSGNVNKNNNVIGECSEREEVSEIEYDGNLKRNVESGNSTDIDRSMDVESDSTSEVQEDERDLPADISHIDVINMNDPAEWPETVSNKLRDMLVEKGPIQLKNYDFPGTSDQYGRIRDMAKCSAKAMSFFGIINRLFTLFSASPVRWSILLQKVPNLSIKKPSETRWESRVESVKAVRYQALAIRDALLEVAQTTNDPMIKSESESLALNHLENFEFIVSLVIWYDLLFAVNHVSNILQSINMRLDVAVDGLEGLTKFLKKYRDTGFNSAITDAKEIAEILEVNPEFTQSRIRKKRDCLAMRVTTTP